MEESQASNFHPLRQRWVPATPEPVAAVPPGVAESQPPANGETPSVAQATPRTIVTTSKRPGTPLDIGLAWEYCLVLGNGWSVLYPRSEPEPARGGGAPGPRPRR